MEQRREDKCIILKLPRSQLVNRTSKLTKAKLSASVKKAKGKKLKGRR